MGIFHVPLDEEARAVTMFLMQIGIFRSLTNHYGKKVSGDIYTVMCNFILKDHE